MPRVEFCASCGAPLEARWAEIVIVCRYCGCQNVPGAQGEPVPSSVPDDGRPRFSVAGRTYVVEGHIGAGDACEVYRGRWVARLGELVVIKVLRALGDQDLLRRERDVLERLQASDAQGAPHFVRRLPEPIALGLLRRPEDPHGERPVLILRWQSGFVHSLEEVYRVHPKGVDSRICVWLFKRLLEALGFIHVAGVIHGAVTPQHVLVHPRDHGANLIGFGTACAHEEHKSESLPAISRTWAEVYPDEVGRERFVSPASDIAMAARCVLYAAGARTFDEPGTLPGALGRLVIDAARGNQHDAWGLRELVSRASSVEHGPAGYNPLPMPGWPAWGEQS